MTEQSEPVRLHDIVVVSDLHIGRGKNRESGRYYELETFFYDDDFRRFCGWLCDDARANDRRFKLIFNGDAFDLLRLDPVPLEGDTPERRSGFAPVLTPSRAAAELSRILDGHPRFCAAMGLVLREGHEIIMLPGNHDIELQWAPVQQALREALLQHGELGSAREATEALARLRFEPWFYHEPGRAWIEHGCQYDPENAFRYPLRRGLVDLPDAVHEAELDNPLGNFFQRYLYNAFGHITFIVPSTRANSRYLKWLAFNNPQLLLGVVRSHWRFWWQVVKRVLKYPSRARTRIADNHARELAELAARSGLGERLYAIDRLKDTHTDLVQAIRGLGLQTFKLAGAFLLVSMLVLGIWFAGNHAIDQVQLGLLGKATLFLAFSFVFLLMLFGALAFTVLRGGRTVPPEPMRRAAAELATIVDVPVVSFGHSHDEVLWRIGGSVERPAWYFNTGTWIAVFTHDVLLPRERVQFTFLRVRDHEGELLHWSPGRREPLPVILLDEEDPRRDVARPGAPS
ncbi:MAG: metallophosphoesterase [Deltaproteobacteria bacterium]|nr:metallophosphoesterase [Deltaproteobacteria bacterium]MBK8234544.1 metallophosphoesterase [Deltaproteobacteria bacterium]MBP7285011.1 metallophosphoesterase [Nannocystaceae bacterium]